MTPDPRKSINRSSYVDKESLEASFHSKSLPVWDDAAPTPFPESQPVPEIQDRLETPANSLEDSVPPDDKMTVESSDALIEAPPKKKLGLDVDYFAVGERGWNRMGCICESLHPFRFLRRTWLWTTQCAGHTTYHSEYSG